MDATPDKVYDAARYKRAGRGKIYDSMSSRSSNSSIRSAP
jgi:hypothetical protein